MPTEIAVGKDNQFIFDICRRPWTFDNYPDRYTEVTPSCFEMQTKHRGNAYFKHGKECVYSFHDAEFDTTDAAI
jgi:hypothetical protein